MKSFFEKILNGVETLKSMMLRLIDYMAKDDIEKANRRYELQYDKQLNDQEIIEIKKNVIIRLWKYAAAIFIALTIILMSL